MMRPLLALVLMLAACSTPPAAETAPDPVATVHTAVAVTGTTARAMTLYGSADAGPGAERALAVEVEARLARIVAPTGTAVPAGAVVAVLEPTPTTRLDAARATADAAAAERALGRAQRLRADGLMSDADVETARTTAAVAAATVTASGARAATLTLRAPVAGTVQALTAQPGDVIAAGTAVATLGSGGAVRGRFGIDPSVAVQVRVGTPLPITLPGGSAVTGVVAGVDPAVDPTTRQASIFARLPAATRIGVGETLRATLPLGSAATGVVVPYAALLDDGGRSYVFIVTGGVAHARTVTPGSSSGDRIAIKQGVTAGERVVVTGGTALQDGMKVRDAGR